MSSLKDRRHEVSAGKKGGGGGGSASIEMIRKALFTFYLWRSREHFFQSLLAVWHFDLELRYNAG